MLWEEFSNTFLILECVSQIKKIFLNKFWGICSVENEVSLNLFQMSRRAHRHVKLCYKTDSESTLIVEDINCYPPRNVWKDHEVFETHMLKVSKSNRAFWTYLILVSDPIVIAFKGAAAIWGKKLPELSSSWCENNWFKTRSKKLQNPLLPMCNCS